LCVINKYFKFIMVKKMKYWKEVTKEVYYSYDGSDYISMSRAETKDGRYFIVIESGDVKNVIKDLLEELK